MAEPTAINTIVHLENMTIKEVSELFAAAVFDFFFLIFTNSLLEFVDFN